MDTKNSNISKEVHFPSHHVWYLYSISGGPLQGGPLLLICRPLYMALQRGTWRYNPYKWRYFTFLLTGTVDGSEILHRLMLLVVYHNYLQGLYIPGGAGFLPKNTWISEISWNIHSLDGRTLAPVDNSFIPLFTGLLHPRWLFGNSSINSRGPPCSLFPSFFTRLVECRTSYLSWRLWS